MAVDRVKHRRYPAGVMAEIADHLDAVGLLCPLPVLKARKRLKALPAGALLEMRADDPAAVIDVPHFCAEAGHALVETREDGAVQVYVIRKGG